MDQLDEKQKPLGEQIMKVSSVGIGGPYNPMIRSPVLGQRLFDLFYYLRWETSVPTKLNEFAILIIGRQWRSQVEWYAHAPLAAKAGLSADIIAELKADKRPSSMAEDEAVVYDFVTELTTTKKVSDETFARAKKVFNDQQIVDLTAVAGNYVMVAMLLAMAEETVPPGKEEPFKAGETVASRHCEDATCDEAIQTASAEKIRGLLRLRSAMTEHVALALTPA